MFDKNTLTLIQSPVTRPMGVLCVSLMVGKGFISPYWVFFNTETHVARSI